MPYTVPLGIGQIIGAGTPGSVLFVGANGELAQDNANFFYDNTNNQLLLGDGSSANPIIARAADTNLGLIFGVGALAFVENNAVRAQFTAVTNGGRLTVLDNSGAGMGLAFGVSVATPDVGLSRDAANVLAQRNGTNAQEFRIYNTFTDAANQERAALIWSGNTFFIQTTAGGSGSNRPIRLQTNGAVGIDFYTNANARWRIASDGFLRALTDNSLDIGDTGANRPRTIYVGTSVQIEANNGLKATNQVNGAAANVGTLNNAPAAGDPAFWMPITVNGVNRHIPCW